ncbi:hypothetical protein Pelo_13728 [Pelomyxa schiedti]|nr:hypothetical protein Pelo_13728 [Pelomyxa schiedti]
MDVFGVVCRLVSISTLTFGQPNTVTLEFTTPYFVDVDGVAVCFATDGVDLTDLTSASISLMQGGDQFDSGPQPHFWTHLKFSLFRICWGTIPIMPRVSVLYDDLAEAIGENLLAWKDAEGNGTNNCLLVSGSFSASTRFELNISLINPPNTAGGNNTAEMKLWLLPVNYDVYDDNLLVYSRGNKLGTVCTLKTGLSSTLANVGQVPPDTSIPISSCTSGTLSTRYGGECIQGCNNSDPLDPFLNCANYFPDCLHLNCNRFLFSTLQETLLSTNSSNSSSEEGTVSDLSVSSTYITELLDYGGSFIDLFLVLNAIEEYWTNYVTDSRQPDIPSRKYGVEPNCIQCDGGFFQDSSTGSQSPVYDQRFASLNVFRLIGLILSNSGFQCLNLFDPSTGSVPFGAPTTPIPWLDYV